jgi:hypothetical protein
MNAEITKAMNKKEKKHTLRKWWSKNDYKVLRVIFFPIWIASVIKEKVTAKLNARQVWSEERADEILSYYIPRRAEWDADDKTFYFFDNGRGWGMKYRQKEIKRKDRRWWRKFVGFCGGDIRKYLIDKFELEGFEKKVGDCSNCWTEVCFRLIEK